MKSYPRLSPYKTENDPLSAFLSEFRFDVEYFTNWPQQDHKTLRNIVGSQMKLVLLESGHSTLFADKKNYAMSAGSCLFIPPYTVYDVETFEGVNSYEIFFSIYPIVRELEFLQYAYFTSITSFPSFIPPMNSRSSELVIPHFGNKSQVLMRRSARCSSCCSSAFSDSRASRTFPRRLPATVNTC